MKHHHGRLKAATGSDVLHVPVLDIVLNMCMCFSPARSPGHGPHEVFDAHCGHGRVHGHTEGQGEEILQLLLLKPIYLK